MKKHLELSIQFITDFYKYSHNPMYFPGTKRISSYFESRGSNLPYADSTIFAGLHYYLHFLNGPVITAESIDMAEDMCNDVFNQKVFEREFWEHILHKYGGKLPLEIKAVPEGTKVKTGNLLFDVTCFDEKLLSLTNYVESLLQETWYPTTVCTVSYYIKQRVKRAFKETVDEEYHGAIPYVLNDFGVRGCGEPHEAGIGGVAHLFNFLGSDNSVAYMFAKHYYNGQRGKIISTIPASEHSVMTLCGKDGETKVFSHCMDVYPKGGISLVCDGFDVLNASSNIFGKNLKSKVENRDGFTCLRLDSGDPKATILAVLNILFEKFGYTVNKKGYKQLPDYIRIMQADGVEYDSIDEIYNMLKAEGISAVNIVFGMGGALLRKVNRDTFKFALKCSAGWRVNGVTGQLEEFDVQKSPMELDWKGVQRQSFKKSKAGELKLISYEGELITVKMDDPKYAAYENILKIVFKDGEIIEHEYNDMENIKARIEEYAD